jgi:ribosomal protein S18 acetylase RimI-like enzyme
MTEIRQVETAEDIEAAKLLFREYAASLDVDLCFQGFDEEVEQLPGKYAPPSGALLLAWEDGVPLGCVALRPQEPPAIAELKRLYFRPAARGRGIWKRMLLDIFDRARAAGYKRIRLDTLPSMTEAQRIYRAMGFKEIGAYCLNPHPGAIYMELELGK